MKYYKICPECNFIMEKEIHNCICGFMFNIELCSTINKQDLLKWVKDNKHHTEFSNKKELIINYTNLLEFINSK